MEALIYPVIECGYLRFGDFASGSVTWTDFLRARKLLEFNDWLHGAVKKKSDARNKEWEYFK